MADEKHAPPATRHPSPATRVPTPAWRYEQPTGHRVAIVRIYCQDDARTRSIGSGTLVKWGGKLVVLTARHVVKDAKKIVVELVTKKTHDAKVLKVDAIWDCAVLELTGRPEGVEPATIELGPNALQKDGSRLESCGYGPDGKLASNGGLFIGYRRSTATPDGPDDWLVISGHARQGDSGGGVFNERGRLVGVLWGTDGKEVVCVQAGRIHKILDEAVPRTPPRPVQQMQCGPNGCGVVQRRPTPPREPEYIAQPPMVMVPQAPSVATETARENDGVLLPWRGEAERRDASQQAQLDRLIELERLRQQRIDREKAGPSVNVEVGQKPEVKPAADGEPSPLAAGLCVFGGVVAGFVVYFSTQKS